MITTREYQVKYPVEVFEDWVRECGIADGFLLENYDITVKEIVFDRETQYIIVDGDLKIRVDS